MNTIFDKFYFANINFFLFLNDFLKYFFIISYLSQNLFDNYDLTFLFHFGKVIAIGYLQKFLFFNLHA